MGETKVGVDGAADTVAVTLDVGLPPGPVQDKVKTVETSKLGMVLVPDVATAPVHCALTGTAEAVQVVILDVVQLSAISVPVTMFIGPEVYGPPTGPICKVAEAESATVTVPPTVQLETLPAPSVTLYLKMYAVPFTPIKL